MRTAYDFMFLQLQGTSATGEERRGGGVEAVTVIVAIEVIKRTHTRRRRLLISIHTNNFYQH